MYNGGKLAHEFMLDTPNGEDYLILCKKCGYQANREIAKFNRYPYTNNAEAALEKVATPNKKVLKKSLPFYKCLQKPPPMRVF
jgi:prolyl-tRNA synthetase